MKRFFFALLLGTVLLCQAEAKNPPLRHHTVRLGWGDPLFETFAFHPGATQDGKRTHDFGFTGHLFAEYRYSLNRVVSLGVQADWEGIFWKESKADMYRKYIGPATTVNNYNLCVIPMVRFTFFQREWVQLYAGAGIGPLFAFDNARNLEVAPALNLNLLGVQVGKGHWSGSVELGGLSALSGANKIYMLGSRLVSISLNYSW